MKTIQKKLLVLTALMGICICLLSFSSPRGGEGFEIYLKNKLMVQQFGKEMNSVKTLQLNPNYANEEITIKYYHCGQAGKDRHVTIKDMQGKVLKDWRFYDNSRNGAMDCPVNEIVALQKQNSSVDLYYSSKELPNGRLLVTLTSSNDSQVKP